jgi:hypothetical protein
MFGTFEAERRDVKIVYGLVDQPQFFNPLKHQVGLLDQPQSLNPLKHQVGPGDPKVSGRSTTQQAGWLFNFQH